MRPPSKFSLVLALVLSGCAQGGGGTDSGFVPPTPDAAADAGQADAGEFPFDVGPPIPDTGVPLVDTGVPIVDAGPADAGPADAGPSDAGPMCTLDIDCDDSDACTVDSCSGTMCAYTSATTSGTDCAAPIDISAGGAFSGDSTCAANDGAGACSAGDAPDVHFTFTLTQTSDVTLDTLGSSFDAVIGLGSSCLGGELGCDDDTAGGGQARLVRTDLAAGTYFVTLDGKAGGAGGAWTLNASIAAGTTTEDVAFPSASDEVFPFDGRFWFAGDYVQGTRTTSMPDVTGASLVVTIPYVDLSCSVTLGVAINGTAVGTFVIAPGATSATGGPYTFSALTGPSYTLRYERLSSSICGEVQVGPGGTVTLSR